MPLGFGDAVTDFYPRYRPGYPPAVRSSAASARRAGGRAARAGRAARFAGAIRQAIVPHSPLIERVRVTTSTGRLD